MKQPTTRIIVEMPVDLGHASPQNTALTRLATMLEHGNRIVGDRWLVVTDSIRLVPPAMKQPQPVWSEYHDPETIDDLLEALQTAANANDRIFPQTKPVTPKRPNKGNPRGNPGCHTPRNRRRFHA